MVELLPVWCADPEEIPIGLELEPWTAAHLVDKAMSDCDGDDWQPGVAVILQRQVSLDPTRLSEALGLPFGTRVGLAARWYCASTSRAGVHTGGPTPLEQPRTLRLEVGAAVAGSLTVETYIVVTKEGQDPPLAGATVWCDSWSTRAVPKEERFLLLEGDQLRPRVRVVDFSESRNEVAGSPFHIHIEEGAALEDPVANVVTIEINRANSSAPMGDGGDDPEVEPEIPELLVQTVRVAWLRAVADRFLTEDWKAEDIEEGSIGWLVHDVAMSVAGSWSGARDLLEEAPSMFESALWHAYTEGFG